MPDFGFNIIIDSLRQFIIRFRQWPDVPGSSNFEFNSNFSQMENIILCHVRKEDKSNEVEDLMKYDKQEMNRLVNMLIRKSPCHFIRSKNYCHIALNELIWCLRQINFYNEAWKSEASSELSSSFIRTIARAITGKLIKQFYACVLIRAGKITTK